jgi:hypothetical protein
MVIMNKQEYLDSMESEVKSVAEIREEKIYPNGDKVYVIDCRHIEGDKVWYMEERFVVINEGKENESVHKM